MEISCYEDFNRRLVPVCGDLRTGQPEGILTFVKSVEVRDVRQHFVDMPALIIVAMKFHRIPWNTTLGNARRRGMKVAEERDRYIYIEVRYSRSVLRAFYER